MQGDFRMGVFSKHIRYREAGEEANVNNVARFGQPHHSLFTSAKFFSLHHHIDIMDEQEKVVYRAKSKVLSIRDKTDVFDVQGNPVAHIEAKVFTIHEIHYVTMADGTKFELSNEVLHLVKDITNIVGLGWQLRGNIAALNFELYDQDDSVIAVIGQKLLSIHDKYCIDIYKPEYEQIVIAILVTLQHMLVDRAASSSAAASVFSSN